ncbi:MAG: DNA-processing protein DprA [Prevotella sp.]|nr:DNA-processing protein DprA [Prevotella sp.]
MTDEALYTMALTRLSGFNSTQAKQLYDTMGSATAVYQQRKDIAQALPDSTPRLREALRHWDDALRRAEAEANFVERNKLRVLVPANPDYPYRLAHCPDAPLALYYRGNCSLNARRVVAVVGTRRCTIYGQELTARFCKELQQLCPGTLVVSGLAYGIDICAHRATLEAGADTVAVLAHGQDQIYPPRHIDTARLMVRQGALITEYMSQTNADKLNFVRRNRIVAGMADATVVIESAARGGSLITAGIARDYNRDVMAFPGAVGVKSSEGCNNLIKQQAAQLITSAADLVQTMGWQDDAEQHANRRKGIERQLFPELTPEQNTIVAALRLDNDQQINTLTVKTGLEPQKLTALLFELEMTGVIRLMAGGAYHLIL